MKSFKTLWSLLLLFSALSLIAEIPLSHALPDDLSFAHFGFSAWFGFVSCIVLIFVALLLGILVKRKEDYYRND